MESLNKLWFLSINFYAGQNHLVDFIMIVIAKYMPYLFIVLLFYLWFKNKKNEALYATYAATLGIVINQIIGLFYFHPRPFVENVGTILISHNADSSFPSDHTTFLLSIAFLFLTFKSTRILGIITTILGLMCGIARIFIGVHWPFDILGSIVVSILAVCIIYCFRSQLFLLNKLIIKIYNKILSKGHIA